jgi:hypothetical protein
MPEPVKPRPASALAPAAATRAHRTHAGAPPEKAVNEKQWQLLNKCKGKILNCSRNLNKSTVPGSSVSDLGSQSGFNQVSESVSGSRLGIRTRIQKSKNDQQKYNTF